MDVFKDERFKHIGKDPKFRNVPKKERKVKIDKRFQSMFTDAKFKLNYSVDQRGRPIKHSQAEDYKKYYDLSDSDKEESYDEKESDNSEDESSQKNKHESSEEEEGKKVKVDTENKKAIKILDEQDEIEKSKLSVKVVDRLQDLSVDYARGEGILDTDSSSSDEVTTEDSEEEIEHDWGELDKDADMIDDATYRLAICHLDWDRVTATDIFVLLNSFLPSTGYIKSVTIYPSEFGLQRMKEEEIKGPQELTDKKVEVKSDEEVSDENDDYHREKLRQYQMKRLKYYYAVAEFDCAESANKVYTECDRIEYESSATRLDLRFIPDDMTFDQEPKEMCSSMPEKGKYKPRLFANTALQQEKVELTWDETDPNRIDLTRKIAQGANVSESDLKAYIATSSEESDSDQLEDEKSEDSDDVVSNKNGKEDEIEKYRSLLASLQKEEEKKKQGKVEMEISWDLAVEKNNKERDEKNKKSSLTPFEKKISKKLNKKNRKDSDSDNLLSDDDLPSDFDMNDPFFKDEFNNSRKTTRKEKNKKKNKFKEDIEDEESLRKKAELELLLADDEQVTTRKHFNMQSILEREANKNKKNKDQEEDDFRVNVKDDRFSALYTSHLFNIDPTDPHFKKTQAMEEIIAEKSKRRKLNNYQNDFVENKKQKKETAQLSDEISKLVSSVKKKSIVNK